MRGVKGRWKIIVTKMNKKVRGWRTRLHNFQRKRPFCKRVQKESWKDATGFNWCYELNVFITPNSYIKALNSNIMVLGGGAFGR